LTVTTQHSTNHHLYDESLDP